jgi:hypothetical protein
MEILLLKLIQEKLELMDIYYAWRIHCKGVIYACPKSHAFFITRKTNMTMVQRHIHSSWTRSLALLSIDLQVDPTLQALISSELPPTLLSSLVDVLLHYNLQLLMGCIWKTNHHNGLLLVPKSNSNIHITITLFINLSILICSILLG